VFQQVCVVDVAGFHYITIFQNSAILYKNYSSNRFVYVSNETRAGSGHIRCIRCHIRHTAA